MISLDRQQNFKKKLRLTLVFPRWVGYQIQSLPAYLYYYPMLLRIPGATTSKTATQLDLLQKTGYTWPLCLGMPADVGWVCLA